MVWFASGLSSRVLERQIPITASWRIRSDGAFGDKVGIASALSDGRRMSTVFMGDPEEEPEREKGASLKFVPAGVILTKYK